MRRSLITYRPLDWQSPEAWPDAEDLAPPWQAWVQDFELADGPTILDWVQNFYVIGEWWTLYMEFYRLVASKLVVMDHLEDPNRVEIGRIHLEHMDLGGQWDHVARLQAVAEEVHDFLGTPPLLRGNLFTDIRRFSTPRKRYAWILESLDEYQGAQENRQTFADGSTIDGDQRQGAKR